LSGFAEANNLLPLMAAKDYLGFVQKLFSRRCAPNYVL